MAEFASSAVGTAGLTTGIIGTALGVASSGILPGIFGNGNAQNNYVQRETFDLSLQLAASQRDNAIITSELASEKKMVEVFTAATDRINAVRDELGSRIYELEKKVSDNAAAQAVINCGLSNNIGILQTQMEQVLSMTKLGILNSSLWPASGG